MAMIFKGYDTPRDPGTFHIQTVSAVKRLDA